MKDVDISIVNWSEKQSELTFVRRVVFVEEQNVPESIEQDGRDSNYCHVLASTKEGRPVGTARMDQEGKIGRMAVLCEYRDRGIGRQMLQALMDRGRSDGIKDFHVSAQIGAVGFYQKMGFEPSGEAFEEAGIKHVNMRAKMML